MSVADERAQRRHDLVERVLAYAWFAPIGLGDLGQLADELLAALDEIGGRPATDDPGAALGPVEGTEPVAAGR